jgi:putative membrane protein
LVFRINTAYDRWWEGRKLWGALVNHSRSLAIKLNNVIPSEDQEARKIISELLGNFPYSLKLHLRNNAGIEKITFNAILKQEEFEKIDHKPNYIVNKLTALCLELSHKYPKSNNDYLIYSELLSHLTDICGACERIKTTPIPYSYSIFIKKIIFIYVITMPIAFGLTIGYWSVPIVMIIFYAFASLELLSEEIEDPFGTDLNDLPLDALSEKIKSNVSDIFFKHGN